MSSTTYIPSPHYMDRTDAQLTYPQPNNNRSNGYAPSPDYMNRMPTPWTYPEQTHPAYIEVTNEINKFREETKEIPYLTIAREAYNCYLEENRNCIKAYIISGCCYGLCFRIARLADDGTVSIGKTIVSATCAPLQTIVGLAGTVYHIGIASLCFCCHNDCSEESLYKAGACCTSTAHSITVLSMGVFQTFVSIIRSPCTALCPECCCLAKEVEKRRTFEKNYGNRCCDALKLIKLGNPFYYKTICGGEGSNTTRTVSDIYIIDSQCHNSSHKNEQDKSCCEIVCGNSYSSTKDCCGDIGENCWGLIKGIFETIGNCFTCKSCNGSSSSQVGTCNPGSCCTGSCDCNSCCTGSCDFSPGGSC